jgi:excisionase family DNA binding protein
LTQLPATTWFTLAEATAHIRAKDTRILRDAIKAGDIPAYQYGHKEFRLTAEDVDKWMRSHPFNE